MRLVEMLLGHDQRGDHEDADDETCCAQFGSDRGHIGDYAPFQRHSRASLGTRMGTITLRTCGNDTHNVIPKHDPLEETLSWKSFI